MTDVKISRNKPYIIRALNNWLEDNNLTTDIIVLSSYPNVNVPKEFINENGTIVLNISLRSTRFLNIDNLYTTFTSRFNGKEIDISFPTEAIAAVQAREINQLFPMEMLNITEVENLINSEDTNEEIKEDTKEKETKKKDRSHLSIVKD